MGQPAGATSHSPGTTFQLLLKPSKVNERAQKPCSLMCSFLQILD